MKTPFSIIHVLGFGVATALMLGIRFGDLSGWLWLPAILTFGTAEIHGAVSGRAGSIDTWSQIIWAFYAGTYRSYPNAFGLDGLGCGNLG